MARVIIEGIERLQEKLEKLAGKAREEVVQALDRSAVMVLRSAQQKCPVRTGNLRASLTKEVSSRELYAVVGTKVHYAPYVEYGTRKMAPRPYLRPAYLENEQSIKEMLKDAVVEAVRKL